MLHHHTGHMQIQSPETFNYFTSPPHPTLKKGGEQFTKLTKFLTDTASQQGTHTQSTPSKCKVRACHADYLPTWNTEPFRQESWHEPSHRHQSLKWER